jgi:hypothetical protein
MPNRFRPSDGRLGEGSITFRKGKVRALTARFVELHAQGRSTARPPRETVWGEGLQGLLPTFPIRGNGLDRGRVGVKACGDRMRGFCCQ